MLKNYSGNKPLEPPQYGTRDWFEMMFSTSDADVDRWGHQWRGSQKFRYQLTLSVIQTKLFEPQSMSVLDIGCGLGDFTHMMHSINKNNNLYGMDISEKAVTRAQNKYRDIEFRCGALPEIRYRNKQFSGVVAMDCINYLDKHKRGLAVKMIFQRLKPQGWFLFSSPIDDGTFYFSDAQARKLVTDVGFTIDQYCYNFAKLYNRIEKPLIRFINLSRIMEEVAEPDKTELSKNKRILQYILQIPLIGYLTRGFSNLLIRVFRKILESKMPVTFFQKLGRIVLRDRGRSHILILAVKHE